MEILLKELDNFAKSQSANAQIELKIKSFGDIEESKSEFTENVRNIESYWNIGWCIRKRGSSRFCIEW